MRILHAQHVVEAQRIASVSTAHVAHELQDRMRRLLVGEDPDAQDVLLAGFHCAELYQMVTAAGFEVMSWGDHQAELNGKQYVGVIRDIVFARGRLAGFVEPRLAPVTVRVSGRKRNAPASYELRDENDELMEDAVRTGPIIDWSWLPQAAHIAACVRPRMDIILYTCAGAATAQHAASDRHFQVVYCAFGKRQNVPAMAAGQ